MKKPQGDHMSLKDRKLKLLDDSLETGTVNLSVTISKRAVEGIQECAKKYRTSRSHIADLVFCNIHKLRLVDIVEDAPEGQAPTTSVTSADLVSDTESDETEEASLEEDGLDEGTTD
jgi:hypothetical protein